MGYMTSTSIVGDVTSHGIPGMKPQGHWQACDLCQHRRGCDIRRHHGYVTSVALAGI